MPPRLKKTRTSPRKNPTARHATRLKTKSLYDQCFGVMDTTRQLVGTTTKNTVQKWFAKFKEENKPDEEIILSQPRSGAPREATTPVKKAIIKFTKGKRKRSIRKNIKNPRQKESQLAKMQLPVYSNKLVCFPTNAAKYHA